MCRILFYKEILPNKESYFENLPVTQVGTTEIVGSKIKVGL